MKTITAGQVEEVRAELRTAGLSPNTAKRIVSPISKVFKHLRLHHAPIRNLATGHCIFSILARGGNSTAWLFLK